MNLYTSDLHFGHRNVINFDKRPFQDVTDMDQMLIKLWNSRVSKEDHVYIVGDFAYRNDKTADWYLRQLKGHKHLIVGNHDKETLANEKAMAYFESVDKMLHVTDGDKQICLCHFPMAEWNGYHRGTWHIYGHIHGRKDEAYEFMKTKEKALNAGCMVNNYSPGSINELIYNNQMLRRK